MAREGCLCDGCLRAVGRFPAPKGLCLSLPTQRKPRQSDLFWVEYNYGHEAGSIPLALLVEVQQILFQRILLRGQ